MDLKLQGRRALVSGSTAGIGRAIAASLAREGARVIVNGRAQSSVDKAVAELKAATGGDIVGFAGDLGTAASADEIAHRHPDVEILVNNLAIFEPKPFEEIPDADWSPILRNECLERNPSCPPVSTCHETRQLGKDHFYLK